MEDHIRKVLERFWRDVAGLPWKDSKWLEDKAHQKKTMKHYVEAHLYDIMTALSVEELNKSMEEDNGSTDSKNN